MSVEDPAHVAEQTGVVLGARVTAAALEPLAAGAREAVTTEAMGAVVVFEGTVRDHDGGRRVAALSYTAHPEAEAMLAAVAGEVRRRHPETRLWAAHRVGPLAIGELAFLVVVAAAHRAAAFAACADLVDAVKAGVPIWKEQRLVDGTVQWVGVE
ncbi:molybdenum cofactor biosynthesis protein MoaE [Corynebacterium sphenisci]|uniref:molybdenum cofactor biosynthesis protein MoaE n=1 Tax=Corynebacterium sphenisci TaxID=191493 RepID=UPI0026E0A526|nr:molybdenum cofactor biosynthesis protein MoaE [Corynebacterium sphenisci]MDO5731031.1 molybdenum cofactor biosynthesis protein MoaE [Corynebacterium sphenisci]